MLSLWLEKLSVWTPFRLVSSILFWLADKSSFTVFMSEYCDGIVFIAVINELSETRVIKKVVFYWGKAFLMEVS